MKYFLPLVFIVLDVFQNGALAGMTSITLHGVTDTLSPEYQKYGDALEIVVAAFREFEALFNDPDYHARRGWYMDYENSEGDVAYSKNTPLGKMITVRTELPLTPEDVMNETWHQMPDLPVWNDKIKYAQVVAAPTENFDIVAYGSNNVLIASGRDFVSARLRRKTENGHMLVSRSVDVEVPGLESVDGRVRAHLHLAGVCFQPHPKKPGHTLTNVVMLVDLKGMLPTFAVNRVLGRIALLDAVTNRHHFNDVKKRLDAERSLKP
ncbi:unnamed protein product [Caenorhabditis auriculariae]|uniref:START domain-containing protein n=1 Tax=Caenorhabditis auriculariae TaxID=2777116 RepID=A0A8S1HC90_9PELO|nr:unnamed protein product [Caenorhabditis auriculariae]